MNDHDSQWCIILNSPLTSPHHVHHFLFFFKELSFLSILLLCHVFSFARPTHQQVCLYLATEGRPTILSCPPPPPPPIWLFFLIMLQFTILLKWNKLLRSEISFMLPLFCVHQHRARTELILGTTKPGHIILLTNILCYQCLTTLSANDWPSWLLAWPMLLLSRTTTDKA